MDPDDTRVGVLIADDDDRFRMVVSALLSGNDEIHVVGEAAGGREAVRQAQELVPDLVMLDVRMPDMDGLEAASVIHRMLPTTKIVMLTVSDEEEDVYEALKAGASGYLLKENIMNDLAGAVGPWLRAWASCWLRRSPRRCSTSSATRRGAPMP